MNVNYLTMLLPDSGTFFDYPVLVSPVMFPEWKSAALDRSDGIDGTSPFRTPKKDALIIVSGKTFFYGPPVADPVEISMHEVDGMDM